MPVDVLTEIEIDRPCDQVAGFASDPSNACRWYANIKSVEWETPQPLQLGTRVAFVAHFLGRRMAYTYEVVEWEPGQHLVMRTAQGPFPMQTAYRFSPRGPGSTHMTLRNSGEPTGFAAMTAPLMVSAMRRANRKDLHALKALLERDGELPGRRP